ncbi:hypothetical protein SNARM312S_01370 [Streptomyces narbonensis]
MALDGGEHGGEPLLAPGEVGHVAGKVVAGQRPDLPAALRGRGQGIRAPLPQGPQGAGVPLHQAAQGDHGGPGRHGQAVQVAREGRGAEAGVPGEGPYAETGQLVEQAQPGCQLLLRVGASRGSSRASALRVGRSYVHGSPVVASCCGAAVLRCCGAAVVRCCGAAVLRCRAAVLRCCGAVLRCCGAAVPCCGGACRGAAVLPSRSGEVFRANSPQVKAPSPVPRCPTAMAATGGTGCHGVTPRGNGAPTRKR